MAFHESVTLLQPDEYRPEGVLTINTVRQMSRQLWNKYTFHVREGTKELGVFCFWKNGARKISVPQSVEAIGDYACVGCSKLRTVKIARDSRLGRIGDAAFHNCLRLKRVSLPEGLERIGAKCFSNTCVARICVPASVACIGESAFEGCARLCAVTFARGSVLKEIGRRAFSGCRALADVAFPEGLERLGDECFFGTALALVVVPEGLASVGRRVFPREAAVSRPAGFRREGVLTRREVAAAVAAVPGEAVFSVPEGVRAVDMFCFSGVSVAEVRFPASVERVGECAFEGQRALRAVRFAAGSRLREVGGGAFCGCAALERVSLPASVEKVGAGAFESCAGLRAADFSGGAALREIGDAAFCGCVGLREVPLPQGLARIGADAFSESGLYSVRIPESVTEIGRAAFSVCQELQRVTVEEGDLPLTLGPALFAESARLRCVALPRPVVYSNGVADLGIESDDC